MKNILIIIIFMASAVAMAQKLGEQAVFAECKKEELPAKCTEDKITGDITALLTRSIVTDIEKNINRNFFTVSIEFISDENGKIIESETGIMCEDNAALKNAIKSYIVNLPLFIPKDKELSDRRSYTAVNIIYIKNEGEKTYHIADHTELADGIGDYNIFGPHSAPVFPGCESNATNQEKADCLKTLITKDIVKNFVMPNVENAGQDKMYISMIIAIDGKLRIENIEGSSAPFRNEVYRAIKKMPKIKPAEEKGIPVAMRLGLPLTLRVK